MANSDGVLEGLCRMLRKPTKEETKPPPTAAELAALEEERVRAAELAEFERLEREAAAEEPGAGAEAEVKPEAADADAKPDEPTRDATETGAGAADDADKDEEDEETKIKGLFEDVTDFKGDEIYRPFISKKQFVTKLEENHIFISTHRLTKHMVRWGYSKEDRNRRGDRGWLNIQFVNSMLD